MGTHGNYNFGGPIHVPIGLSPHNDSCWVIVNGWHACLAEDCCTWILQIPSTSFLFCKRYFISSKYWDESRHAGCACIGGWIHVLYYGETQSEMRPAKDINDLRRGKEEICNSSKNMICWTVTVCCCQHFHFGRKSVCWTLSSLFRVVHVVLRLLFVYSHLQSPSINVHTSYLSVSYILHYF